jgi:uncharacterized protein (TIGR03435 family)
MVDVLQKMGLHGLLCAVVVSAIAAPNVFGQTNTSLNHLLQAAKMDFNLPEFEVASIKPSPEGGIRGFSTYPGGKVMCEFCTLEMLMMSAFDSQPFQILDGPRWGHTDGYNVVAIPPSSSESSKFNPPSPKSPLIEEQRRMLQALLRDRFQLRFHSENRTGPVYVLVKGSGKLKLQPANNKNDFPWVGNNIGGAINGDGIAGKNISMPLLAIRLSRYLQRPVLDETDLKGAFDFQYDYLSADEKSNEDFVASILTSVQGIGLKLKADKGPVETIVIDHVERPSAN